MKRLFIVLAISLMATNSFAGSSSIKILEIDPSPTKSLKVGSEIHFKVKLEYNVGEDSAVANLIFQKGEDSGSFDSVIGNTMQVINKGKGTITLEKTITVPDIKVLQVFTPLMIPGQTQTTTVDMKVYKVIK